MLVTVVLWSEVTEAEGTSGGEVDEEVEGEEAGAWGEMGVGDCDPSAGTLTSGLLELCSSGVGVKWTTLLVDENPRRERSGFVPSQLEAGLVIASSLGSVDTFLGSEDVGVKSVTGSTEVL